MYDSMAVVAWLVTQGRNKSFFFHVNEENVAVSLHLNILCSEGNTGDNQR